MASSIDRERVAAILKLLGINEVPATTVGSQTNTHLKQAVFQSGKAHFFGPIDEFNGAELTQWLSQAEAISQGNDSFVKNHCKTINNLLRDRSYLVGNSLTVADAALLHSLSNRAASIADLPELKRYLDHISRLCTGVGLNAEIAPTVFPIRTRASSNKKADAVATPSATGSNKEAKTAAAQETAPEAVSTKAAAVNKKEEKKSGDATDGSAKAEEGKKAKKEKQPAPAASTAAEGDGAAEAAELDPSKLDIRVGIITKCWNHPESDKLYCEEIDLGEGAPRSIASGLRHFYASADELVGRKVLVLANLKERPLAGFKSNGMVLCASNDDHTAVKFVEVPATANPGDRVVFPGFEKGEPATPAQMAKKKIFEKLAPDLRTDGAGITYWGSVPFTIGGETCTSPLLNGHVS